MDPSLAAFVLYHKVLNETVERMKRDMSLDESLITEFAENWKKRIICYDLPQYESNEADPKSGFNVRKQMWEDAGIALRENRTVPYLRQVGPRVPPKRPLEQIQQVPVPYQLPPLDAGLGGATMGMGGATMGMGVPAGMAMGMDMGLGMGDPMAMAGPGMGLGAAAGMDMGMGMNGPMGGPMGVPANPFPLVSAPPLPASPPAVPAAKRARPDLPPPLADEAATHPGAVLPPALAAEAASVAAASEATVGAGAEGTSGAAVEGGAAESMDDSTATGTGAGAGAEAEAGAEEEEVTSSVLCAEAQKLLSARVEEQRGWDDAVLTEADDLSDDETFVLDRVHMGKADSSLVQCNMGVALYEKVERKKGNSSKADRWSMQFATGVMRIGLEDILFHSMGGSMEW